jgi:hypothetical protein
LQTKTKNLAEVNVSKNADSKNHAEHTPRGERHGLAKFSDADVELVRALRDAGWTYRRIAEKMEMSRSNVFDICQFRTRCPDGSGGGW